MAWSAPRSIRLSAAALLLLCGCSAGDAASAADSTAATSTAAAASAAVPPRDAMDERLDSALVRLRQGQPVPTALEHGEASRDALVERFVRAIEAADTTDLRRMVMSRAEFAHLYYPGSAYTRRPTRQEADLAWFLHLNDSQKGVSRALARYGTEPLNLLGYECAAEPRREGRNVVWHGCHLRIAPRGDTLDLRLFGSILERDGRFKLYSYANDL